MTKKTDINSFIEGATKETASKKARKRPDKSNILLIVLGRNVDIEYSKSAFIKIRSDIQVDMDKYCSGTKQGIINHLLRRGLDDLINKGERVVEEQD